MPSIEKQARTRFFDGCFSGSERTPVYCPENSFASGIALEGMMMDRDSRTTDNRHFSAHDASSDHEHPDLESEHDHRQRQKRVRALASSGKTRSSIKTYIWRTVCLLVVTAALFGGGLFWRISQGPLSLPFITAFVHDRIEERLGADYRLGLDSASVFYGDKGVTLSLDGLVILDQHGPLVSAPHLLIATDTLSLLRGVVVARSVTVDGAAVTLNVSAEGRVSLRPGAGDTPVTEKSDTISSLAVIQGFDAFLAAAGAIDAVEFRNAILAVHEEAIERRVVHRNINLRIRRLAEAGGASFTLAAFGGEATATISGRGNEERIVDIKAGHLSLRALSTALSPGAKPPAINASFDALIRARIKADGLIAMAQATITSRGGSWLIEDGAPPFSFDGARIAMHWNPVSRMILLDQATVRAGQGYIDFKGHMLPPTSASDAVWRYNFEAQNGLIAAQNPQLPPLKLDTVSMKGSYDPVTRRLSLESGNLHGPTASLAFSGAVTFGSKTPEIAFNMFTRNMSATAMMRLWPFFNAPRMKAWLEQLIKGGMIESGALSVAIPKDMLLTVNGKPPLLPDQVIKGDFVFSNAAIQVADGFPVLGALTGKLRIGARSIETVIEKAEIPAGDAGVLVISNGLYTIHDLAMQPARQRAEFTIKGSSRALAGLASLPPLAGALGHLPVKPEEISGTSELKVKIELPVADQLVSKDIHYSVNGQIMDISGTLMPGVRLNNGNMKVVIEPNLLLLTGEGTVEGMPASMDMRKAADRDAQIAMRLTLDDATRRIKGLDFGNTLTGPVIAEVTSPEKSGGKTVNVDLDFTQANIRDLLPGWQKAAGKQARASFRWTPADNGEGGTLQNIILDAGSTRLRGEAVLGRGFSLLEADMSQLSFSRGDDMRARIEAAGNGWKIDVTGSQLDARPLLAQMQRKGVATDSSSTITSDIKLDKVQGFNGEVLSAFNLALEMNGASVRKLSMKGTVKNGKLVAASQPAKGGGSQIQAQSSNAGAIMRFMDYYTRLEGGALEMTVVPSAKTIRGALVLSGFSVVNEPALGQYRTTLKRSGRSSRDEPHAGNYNSAQFTRLRLVFTRTAALLGVDAVLWGPDVGVSLAGDVDYGADRVNLTGTFVPAYALNNMFGKIPVLGEFLGGGQYGGLFAINFKVNGRVQAPVLTVNPLSAIAPGFLRKIFEFQKQGQ